MSRQAHAAFPPHAVQPPNTPSSSAALYDVVQHCNSPDQVHHVVLPTLAKIAGGDNQHGKTKEEQIRSGEEVLAMDDWDLNAISDDYMRRMTGMLIYVVSARMRSKRGSKGPRTSSGLLDLAIHIALTGEPEQMSACAPRVGIFAWAMLRLAQTLKNKIPTLKDALHRLGIKSSSLYHFHPAFAAFLEVSLIDRDYTRAMQVINEIHLGIKRSQPSYLDIITYYHHAGLICAATRDYTKAVEMFTVVVSVPTSSASAIQLAAAKRAILCELLVSGTAARFPRYTSSAVTRAIEKGATDYTKLAKAFEAQEWGNIKQIEGSHTAVFKNDCNMGLLQAVQASMTRRRILKIKDAYSRLPIEKLAARVGCTGPSGTAEVLATVNDMIRSNTIRATITKPSPDSTIVTFLEGDVHDQSPRTMAQLSELAEMTALLESHLQATSRRMGLEPEYLRKQAATLEITGGKSSRGGGGAGGMTDFESMMAAEEAVGGPGRTAGGKVGGDHTDMGY